MIPQGAVWYFRCTAGRGERPGIADINMTEAQLLARWISTCERLGFCWFHIYNGLICQFGLPDLIIAGPCGVWFVELKSVGATLSRAQDRWRRMLLRAGANYAVHTPTQWLSGESESLLHSIAEDADVIDLAARRQIAA